MKDENKTKKQLINELVELRKQTDRKETEKLYASEKKFRILFNSANDAIVIHDMDGHFLEVNETICKRLGYSREELINMTPMDIDTIDNAARIRERLEELLQRKYLIFETAHTCRDGTVVPVEVSSRVVDYNDAPAILSVARDITKRKQAEKEKVMLEEQLFQSQKMEAIGQLAGGIAHDFNNILTAMMGYCELLKIKMQQDNPLKTYVDHIISLTVNASKLTQSLLAFSRKQLINPHPVDLNDLIREVENILKRIISEDIELKTVFTENDLIIMADPYQIKQIFMNLATNARDAMPEGGKLEINTEVKDLDEIFIKEHRYGKPGRYAFVSVSDIGIGMDEETTGKVFEPFFTTKEAGKGTGLGLSIVYGIIKQHDGYINVYSNPGQGTIFNIYLPLLMAEKEEIKPSVIYPAARGTETILLAEDNIEVRLLIKSILEEFGYKVIEAVDGEDAITQFDIDKDKIQLLLIDVIMPKKNGKHALEEIRKIKPDMPAIFISGYTGDVINQKVIDVDDIEFISKPIVPQVLLRKIREVLDRE